jgi:hypothetical protein
VGEEASQAAFLEERPVAFLEAFQGAFLEGLEVDVAEHPAAELLVGCLLQVAVQCLEGFLFPTLAFL